MSNSHRLRFAVTLTGKGKKKPFRCKVPIRGVLGRVPLGKDRVHSWAMLNFGAKAFWRRMITRQTVPWRTKRLRWISVMLRERFLKIINGFDTGEIDDELFLFVWVLIIGRYLRLALSQSQLSTSRGIVIKITSNTQFLQSNAISQFSSKVVREWLNGPLELAHLLTARGSIE
jgi:hypothetical protein